METECPTKQLNFSKKQAGEGEKATVYVSGPDDGILNLCSQTTDGISSSPSY